MSRALVGGVRSGTQMLEMSHGALELVARRFRALADPSRLAVLHLLMDGEQPVGAIADETHLAVSTVSRHLQRLHRAGFVRRRRDGVQVWYALADTSILELCDVMCHRLDAELDRSSFALDRERTPRH